MVTVINGTANIDTIIGARFYSDELIYGFEGNDILSGYGGDTLFGGLGNDKLTALDNGAKLVGGKGNDILTGFLHQSDHWYGGHSFLYGGVGNDILYGGGWDTLYGGHGADNIFGGAEGRDTLHFDVINEKGILATTAITVDLAAGTSSEGDTIANINNVVTTHSADTVTGNANSNTITLGAGDDVAYGGGGIDYLQGGSGDDKLYGGDEWEAGLEGGIGNDTIYGDAGDDILNGGRGSDFLFGGDGNDILVDGIEDDVSNTLSGGAGADIFVWTQTENDLYPDADIITDFSTSSGDVIKFVAIPGYEPTIMDPVYATDFASLHMYQEGNDVIIWDYGILVLQNVNLADLSANDFIFA